MTEDTREAIAYNEQVDKQIECLLEDVRVNIQELESTKIEISDYEIRKVGICDYFRSSKYYKHPMTDDEIMERYRLLNERYEEEIGND